MFVFQANNAEDMRSQIIELIQSMIRREHDELRNAPTQRAQAVSQGKINQLHTLADTIAEAKIEAH